MEISSSQDNTKKRSLAASKLGQCRSAEGQNGS